MRRCLPAPREFASRVLRNSLERGRRGVGCRWGLRGMGREFDSLALEFRDGFYLDLQNWRWWDDVSRSI